MDDSGHLRSGTSGSRTKRQRTHSGLVRGGGPVVGAVVGHSDFLGSVGSGEVDGRGGWHAVVGDPFVTEERCARVDRTDGPG